MNSLSRESYIFCLVIYIFLFFIMLTMNLLLWSYNHHFFPQLWLCQRWICIFNPVTWMFFKLYLVFLLSEFVVSAKIAYVTDEWMLTLIFVSKLEYAMWFFIEYHLEGNIMDFSKRKTKNEKDMQVIRLKIQSHKKWKKKF